MIYAIIDFFDSGFVVLASFHACYNVMAHERCVYLVLRLGVFLGHVFLKLPWYITLTACSVSSAGPHAKRGRLRCRLSLIHISEPTRPY